MRWLETRLMGQLSAFRSLPKLKVVGVLSTHALLKRLS